MNSKKTDLERKGIFLGYFMGSTQAIIYINLYISRLGTFNSSMSNAQFTFIMLALFYTLGVYLTALYHCGKIKDRIQIGILNIFLSFIGGIFILISHKKPKENKVSKDKKSSDITPLEYELIKLDILLSKGIISSKDYEQKKIQVLENFKPK